MDSLPRRQYPFLGAELRVAVELYQILVAGGLYSPEYLKQQGQLVVLAVGSEVLVLLL